jgi:hypothetical protein
MSAGGLWRTYWRDMLPPSTTLIQSASQSMCAPGSLPDLRGISFVGGSHSVETGLGQPLPTTSLESIVDMRLEHFCYADLLGLKGTPGTVTRDAIVDFLSLFSIQSEHWQTPAVG